MKYIILVSKKDDTSEKYWVIRSTMQDALDLARNYSVYGFSADIYPFNTKEYSIVSI